MSEPTREPTAGQTPPPHGTPQYGPPSGSRYPPYPPAPGAARKRQRPSAWWFAVAAFVLVASVGGGIAGVAYTAVDTFRTVATVSADGTTQRVDAEELDGEAFLWATLGLAERCSIIDSASGEEVRRGPVTATYTTTIGTRTWRVVNRFDPGSGRLDITCPTGSSDVQVGPAADFGTTFGSLALFILLIVFGSLIGIGMLIVITILYATGRPRGESA